MTKRHNHSKAFKLEAVRLLVPLLAAGSVAMQVDPYLLMISAALSASCALMLLRRRSHYARVLPDVYLNYR